MTAVEYDLEGNSESLVSSLEAAIRELTAATKAAGETKKAVGQLTDEQKKAAAATKAAAEEAKKSGDAYGGVIRILKQFGGGISEATDLVDELGEGIEKMIPALGEMGVEAVGAGLAAAGAAAAVAALAYATYSLAVAASDAKDRLEKMGVIIDEDAADRLDAYAAGATRLTVAFDQLEVAAGSKLAEDIGAIETAIADLFHQLEPLNIGVGELVGRLVGLGPLAVYVQEAFDSLFGDEEATNRHLALQKQIHDEYVAELTDMAKVSKEATDKMLGDLQRQEAGNKLVGDVLHGAALSRQKDAEATEKATEQQYLSEIRFGQSFLASVKALEKEQEAGTLRLLAIDIESTKRKASEATAYANQVAAAQEKQTTEFVRELEKQTKALEDAVLQGAQLTEQMFVQVAAELDKMWSAELAKIDQQVGAARSRISSLRSDLDAAHQATLDAIKGESGYQYQLAQQNEEQAQAAYDAERERLNGIEAERKRVAYDAFVAQRESALGQAFMQGGLAIVTAFAQLGPIGGAIAASFVGAMTATQIGIIQAQKPPAHDGGELGADEFSFGNRRVRDGEAAVVFNQRAVQSGALEQAARINRDQGGDGGSREVRLVMADAGRVIGELVARETRRPGSRLAAAFGRSGVTDPYGRGR